MDRNTLMPAVGFENTMHAGPDGWTTAFAQLYLAGKAAFPPACLHYVHAVIRQSAALSASANESQSPASVVADFRAAIRADFGPLRDDVLNEWGLHTPRDLGVAVSLLGQAGVLTVDDGDAPELYAADATAFIRDIV